MKVFIMFAVMMMLLADTLFCQPASPTDTTSQLVIGTYLRDGKIYLSQGYKAKYFPKKNMMLILPMDGGVTGGYICKCGTTNAGEKCKPSVFGPILACVPASGGCDKICTLYVSNDGGTTTTKEDFFKPTTIWKRLVITRKPE